MTARSSRPVRCGTRRSSRGCSPHGRPRRRGRGRRRRGLLGGADTAEALEAAPAAQNAGGRRRGRIRRRCRTRRRPGRCARSSGWSRTTRATGSPRWGCSWCCRSSGSTVRSCPGCGPQLVDGTGPVFWPAVGIAAALVVTMPIPYFTARVVPQVVGHADASDQPAARARADRAATGQRAHARGGRRPGRGHRAGRHHGGQRRRPVHQRRPHRHDDARLAEPRPGAVLRGDRGGVRVRRRRCSGRCSRRRRSGPSRRARRSRRRWCRRSPRRGPSSSPAPADPCWRTSPASTRAAATCSAGDLAAGLGSLDPVGRLRAAADRAPGRSTSTAGSRRRPCSSSCRRWARRGGSPGRPPRSSRSCRRRGYGPGGRSRWPGSRPTPPPCPASTCGAGRRRRRRSPPRTPLRRLDLVGFGAVHEDGTLGAHDVDLTVRRGALVLVVGPGRGRQVLPAEGARGHRPPHRRAALER